MGLGASKRSTGLPGMRFIIVIVDEFEGSDDGGDEGEKAEYAEPALVDVRRESQAVPASE